MEPRQFLQALTALGPKAVAEEGPPRADPVEKMIAVGMASVWVPAVAFHLAAPLL